MMSIPCKMYTAGFPAEFGRKMGGVIEVNTLRSAQPGFTDRLVLSGGSFDTAGSLRPGCSIPGGRIRLASAPPAI